VRLAKADSAALQSALALAWRNIAPKSPEQSGKKKRRFRTASIYDALHRSFFERASAPWLGPNSFNSRIRRQALKRGGR
jgi:hypothetical protein